MSTTVLVFAGLGVLGIGMIAGIVLTIYIANRAY